MKIILLPKVQKIVYNHNRPYTKQKYYTQNYNINDEMVELLNYQTNIYIYIDFMKCSLNRYCRIICAMI